MSRNCGRFRSGIDKGFARILMSQSHANNRRSVARAVCHVVFLLYRSEHHAQSDRHVHWHLPRPAKRTETLAVRAINVAGTFCVELLRVQLLPERMSGVKRYSVSGSAEESCWISIAGVLQGEASPDY